MTLVGQGRSGAFTLSQWLSCIAPRFIEDYSCNCCDDIRFDCFPSPMVKSFARANPFLPWLEARAIVELSMARTSRCFSPRTTGSTGRLVIQPLGDITGFLTGAVAPTPSLQHQSITLKHPSTYLGSSQFLAE